MIKTIFFVTTLLLSGCADHVQFEAINSPDAVGFWYGLWHGMILPLAWFISLFDDSVAIYAVYNSGSWYDFGYFMGVGGFSSGLTISASSNRG